MFEDETSVLPSALSERVCYCMRCSYSPWTLSVTQYVLIRFLFLFPLETTTATQTNTLLPAALKLFALCRQISWFPLPTSLSLLLQHFLGCCLCSNQAIQETTASPFPSFSLPLSLSKMLFVRGLSHAGVHPFVCSLRTLKGVLTSRHNLGIWFSSVTRPREKGWRWRKGFLLNRLSETDTFLRHMGKGGAVFS